MVNTKLSGPLSPHLSNIDILLPLHLLESFFKSLNFLCLSLEHDFVRNELVDVRLVLDLLAVQAEPVL